MPSSSLDSAVSASSLITLEAGLYRAVIDPNGASLYALSYAEHSLTYTAPHAAYAPAYSGKTLVPWPNRITQGRYVFAGQTHQLPINDTEHNAALHGLMAWVRWQVAEVSTTRVKLRSEVVPRPGYPWSLLIDVIFELSADNGMHYSLTALNIGSEQAPFGAAHHPYIAIDNQPVDRYELQIPAEKALAVDENLQPIGLRECAELGVDYQTPRVIGAASLDHAFTHLPQPQWTICIREPESQLTVELSSTANWVQLYTGDELGREGLAVEVMSCAPNAFTNGLGLVQLAPKQNTTLDYFLRVQG